MEWDGKANSLMRIYNQLYSIRKKGDALRWRAMAFCGHRTKESSISDDCPIPDVHLYDAAGKMAVRTLVESLGGAVMSPGQDWFSMRIEPRNYYTQLSPDFGNTYTTYAKKMMANEMNHSNFYDEQSLAFYDSVSCGYSCTMFMNDDEANQICLKTFEPWNCWFDRDLKGRIPIFFHKYTLNGVELLKEFGDSLDKQTAAQAKKGQMNVSFSLLHCIMERDRFRDGNGRTIRFSNRISKRMRYASIHILLSNNRILRESGYQRMPVIIHVWENCGDSPYGIGLVMSHIEEFSKLNRLGFEYGLSVAKLNHGAWLVPDTMLDSFSDNPESIIPYQSSDLIPRPLQESIDVKSIGEQLILQQQNIARIFYNDIFSYLLSQDKVFTATQVNAVKAEGMAKIYPIYTRIQSQKIDPSLKMVFELMIENKRLDKPDRMLMIGSDKKSNRLEFILDSAMSQMIQRYQAQTANALLFDLAKELINLGMGDLVDRYMNVGNLILSTMMQVGASADLFVSAKDRKDMETEMRELSSRQLDLENRLKESEINRNNAGASNLNNQIGMNGGES